MKHIWDKYGLIVVGNIVFFILLYWFAYRPNNADNRAGEFLQLGQIHETEGSLDVASALYLKIRDDYADTPAAKTAVMRLQKIQEAISKGADLKIEPESLTLPLELLLQEKGSWEMAKTLAKARSAISGRMERKYWEGLRRYLDTAVAREGITFQAVSNDINFQGEEFRDKFLIPRGKLNVDLDWIYDDLALKNTNFFPWHNAVIQFSIQQGDEKDNVTVRREVVNQEDVVELLSFHIDNTDDPVQYTLIISCDEGQSKVEKKL